MTADGGTSLIFRIPPDHPDHPRWTNHLLPLVLLLNRLPGPFPLRPLHHHHQTSGLLFRKPQQPWPAREPALRTPEPDWTPSAPAGAVQSWCSGTVSCKTTTTTTTTTTNHKTCVPTKRQICSNYSSLYNCTDHCKKKSVPPRS